MRAAASSFGFEIGRSLAMCVLYGVDGGEDIIEKGLEVRETVARVSSHYTLTMA